MTYPLKFRQKVLSVKEQYSLTYEETAKRFCIGKDSLTRWKNNIEPKATKNRPSIRVDMEKLKKDIEEYPDGYMYERAQRLSVSKSGIYFALRRLGMSFKKRPSDTQRQISRNSKPLLRK